MDELRTTLNAFALLIHVQGGRMEIDADILRDFETRAEGFEITVAPPGATCPNFVFEIAKSVGASQDVVL